MFNSVSKNYVTVRFSEARPVIMPVERGLISVPGFPGGHLSRTDLKARRLEVPINVFYEDFADLQNKKKEMAVWLYHESPKPLIFNDEPDKTYYALLTGEIVLEENVKVATGNLSFICPDPYVYGPEQTLHFPSDLVSIQNKGTAPADPIFELTATKKSTFAMIGNQDDEYMMLGQPADDDVEEVDTRTSVLYENGSTLEEWTHTQDRDFISDDSNIDSLDGELGSDDAGIRIWTNGTPKDRQRGAAIYKELPESIQDFEIESTFDIISRRESENFRTMIYFLDENMNNLGQMGFKDNSRLNKRRRPIAQLGRHNQGERLLGDSSPDLQPAPDTTLMYLRAKREGKRFTFYLAHWRNQRHDTVWEASFNDINNLYQGRLKYITLFIGTYQDRGTPNRNRINSVEVTELTTVEEDQTPYIVYPNDVITFDHVNDDILLNGQVRPDLFTSIGADFFKLKEGYNQIGVLPENSFETNVKFKERFR